MFYKVKTPGLASPDLTWLFIGMARQGFSFLFSFFGSFFFVVFFSYIFPFGCIMQPSSAGLYSVRRLFGVLGRKGRKRQKKYSEKANWRSWAGSSGWLCTSVHRCRNKTRHRNRGGCTSYWGCSCGDRQSSSTGPPQHVLPQQHRWRWQLTPADYGWPAGGWSRRK